MSRKKGYMSKKITDYDLAKYMFTVTVIIYALLIPRTF